MADYFTHFCGTLDVGADNVQAALDLAESMTLDPESFGLQWFSIKVHEHEGALIIDDNCTSDTDAAIKFVTECAQRFKLTGFWALEYCNTATASRPDAYGGGVIAVRLDDGATRSIDTRIIFNAWMKGEQPVNYEDAWLA